jgi:hypothetical protein
MFEAINRSLKPAVVVMQKLGPHPDWAAHLRRSISHYKAICPKSPSQCNCKTERSHFRAWRWVCDINEGSNDFVDSGPCLCVSYT